jgi:hypothetical protein
VEANRRVSLESMIQLGEYAGIDGFIRRFQATTRAKDGLAERLPSFGISIVFLSPTWLDQRSIDSGSKPQRSMTRRFAPVR